MWLILKHQADIENKNHESGWSLYDILSMKRQQQYCYVTEYCKHYERLTSSLLKSD